MSDEHARALAHIICQYVRENIDLESDLVELTLRHLLLNLLDSNINTPTNANPSGRAARVSHYRARVCEETSLARCDSGARGREGGRYLSFAKRISPKAPPVGDESSGDVNSSSSNSIRQHGASS